MNRIDELAIELQQQIESDEAKILNGSFAQGDDYFKIGVEYDKATDRLNARRDLLKRLLETQSDPDAEAEGEERTLGV